MGVAIYMTILLLCIEPAAAGNYITFSLFRVKIT